MYKGELPVTESGLRCQGPGETTVTAGGLLRKTVYFSEEEWQAIRRKAFEGSGNYSEVVRTAVRKFCSL